MKKQSGGHTHTHARSPRELEFKLVPFSIFQFTKVSSSGTRERDDTGIETEMICQRIKDI